MVIFQLDNGNSNNKKCELYYLAFDTKDKVFQRICFLLHLTAYHSR